MIIIKHKDASSVVPTYTGFWVGQWNILQEFEGKNIRPFSKLVLFFIHLHRT